MDKNYFLNHVIDHKYVEACGALQVLKPRSPHEILLAVGGWSGNRRTGLPTNIIEAFDSRTENESMYLLTWKTLSHCFKRCTVYHIPLFL